MPQFRTVNTADKCYSDVARVGVRTLCVTVPELVACGIGETYLWRAIRAQRTGEVYCWPHHKEGNTIYIHYDGLKETYKRMVDSIHCQGAQANLWTANRDAQKRNNELVAVCSQLPQMVEVAPGDLTELRNSGFFKETDHQSVARAAGWLRLWRKLDVKTARKMGFTSVVDLQNALFAHCMSDQEAGFVRFPKPISAIRVLDRKAREFEKCGLQALIGGYFGNANREKIDNTIHAVLMDLAASPLKHSFEDIAMMYNTMSDYENLQRMTTSAIKQHLNLPKHRKVWMYMRHGKLVGDDLYQSQALRETPLNPDDLWSIDGTASQLYYIDAEGRMKSDLYIYFVTDACTGAIIGNAVAYSETSGLVVEALQDAIETHGYRPRQIQYDNSSANIEKAAAGLIKNMSRVSFPCQPYLGRAKYVEEIIGHFQQRVLRKFQNFKGGNVSTKTLNSKANPELLKWLKANPRELPNEQEAIAQIKEAIKMWNERGERRDNYGCWVGQSKVARYEQNAEKRPKFNYMEKLSLFMVELPKLYKYKQQGIAITIKGQKYNYVVPDPDNSANDFLFSNENMYREFRVRVNINNPMNIELFDKSGHSVATAIEKEKFAAAVANMEKKDGAKIVDFLRKQEEYGYDYAMREMRLQRLELAKHGLRATGTGDFFAINTLPNGDESLGWHDAPKRTFNAVESYNEDVANGLERPETPTSRRVRDAREALMKM